MCKKTGVGQGAAEATMSEKSAVKIHLGKKTVKKRAPCARILRRGGATCARRLRRTRHHMQEKTEKGAKATMSRRELPKATCARL